MAKGTQETTDTKGARVVMFSPLAGCAWAPATGSADAGGVGVAAAGVAAATGVAAAGAALAAGACVTGFMKFGGVEA